MEKKMKINDNYSINLAIVYLFFFIFMNYKY